jgi:hypothetical protein
VSESRGRSFAEVASFGSTNVREEMPMGTRPSTRRSGSRQGGPQLVLLLGFLVAGCSGSIDDPASGDEVVDVGQDDGSGGPRAVEQGPAQNAWCTQFPYEITDGDIGQIADFGLGCNRIVVDPRDGNYDARAAEIAREMGTRGQVPIFILMADVTNPPRDDAARAQFAQQCARVVGAVHRAAPGVMVVWELWNEPDGDHFWQTGPNALEYGLMAAVAAPAIRGAAASAGGNFWLVGPAVASVAPGHDHYIHHLFRKHPELLDEFDAISFHGYHENENPEAMMPAFEQLMQTLGRQKPIVLSEWAWRILHGSNVSPDEQADYTVRQFLIGTAAGWAFNVHYTWRDRGSCEADEKNCAGLIKSNGNPRPAYVRVNQLLRELAGYSFQQRLPTQRGWVLVFRGPAGRKVVGWAAEGAVRVVLRGAGNRRIAMNLGGTPTYQPLPEGF